MAKFAKLLTLVCYLLGSALSLYVDGGNIDKRNLGYARNVHTPRMAAASPFRGVGISYTPFTADSKCKSQAEIDSDINRLRKYSTIRLYGVECNQIPMVLSAAKRNGMKIFAGIYVLNDLDRELQTLINSARNSWSDIVAVSIGNEVVARNAQSPGQVVNAINRARSILRGVGYGGPVLTIDTVEATIRNPQLCHASDICAANAHAFFSNKTPANQAGPFARRQADMVSAAVGGKRIIIAESGWPSAGDTNGAAVPSDQNQRIAVQSLRDSFRDRDGELILFSAFDEKWKKDFPGSHNAEKWWGIED
ncbi:Cell surface mannoprotein mp65 [Ophidiomyces ophidiicola]|nr:Cell surface mannoprotein mp65 [Ophidiomyces ophidiicola]